MITVIRIIKKIILFILISHLAYVVLLRFVDPPFTLTQLGSLFNGNGFKRTHVSLDEMSTAAKLAVLAAEDQLFPDHNGFDIKGIKKVKYTSSPFLNQLLPCHRKTFLATC